MKMKRDEILTHLNAARESANLYANERKIINDYSVQCYNSDPWNEIEGRSKVKSTDVYDVVEAPLPGLTAMFLGAKQIHKFSPLNPLDKAEVQECEEKTEYINHLVMTQKNGYLMYSGWMKNALLRAPSVLTYEYVEEEKAEVKEYEGMQQDEYTKLLMDMDADKSVEYEVKELEPNYESGGLDLKIWIKRTKCKYEVRPVHTDCFFISKGAIDKDDAEIIGHDEMYRRGDLIAAGYDKATVEKLPRQARAENGSYYTETMGVSQKASDLILVTQAIMYLDVDGDGIPERRKYIYSGEHILEDEAFDHAPYAILTANIMPFEAIGKTPAEVTVKTEEVKTTLLRGTLDNMYQVLSGRTVVNTEQGTNIDDLTTNRHRGIIRTKGDPRLAAAALEVPFIGDKAIAIIQYMDFARAQRTGTNMASQGLNSDSLREETAARFNGVTDEGEQKTKLIARNFAETGWRELYEGLAWLVAHCQNDRIEINKLGKPLTINPSMWRFDHQVTAEIGLGSGDEAEQTDSLMALYQIQQQLLATQSPIVDQVKVYNVLSKALKNMGYKDVSEIFNNPEVPEEMKQQTIEMLNMQLGQAMDVIQQNQQNPLAEAENIKAQAKLIEAQSRQSIEAAKLAQEQAQFDKQMMFDLKKQTQDLAAKLTEMELKYSQNVPGSAV